MAHYRRFDDAPRRHHRWPTQVNDDGRSWFNDNGSAHWGPRERGGYWRQYEHYVGRGPKGYQDVGTGNTSALHVTKASGKGTPSTSTSGTSA